MLPMNPSDYGVWSLSAPKTIQSLQRAGPVLFVGGTYSREFLLMEIVENMIRVAESAASRAAFNGVLATALPSSMMTVNSDFESSGSISLNFVMVTHELKL